ncbi:hypothetical protein K8I28_10930, partial [bacterium]|nr:hypothetical protein [bacterium]
MTPSELTKLKIEQLWDLWFESNSQLVKDELVIRFIPLVEQVAGRLRMGLPNFVNMDELVNSGVIGLISAIENYDRERANKFETYAVTRIRGSVLDGLRDYDW